MSILRRAIYRFNVSSINVSMTLFTEIEQQQQKKPQIYMELQKTLSQNNPEKKEQS